MNFANVTITVQLCTNITKENILICSIFFKLILRACHILNTIFLKHEELVPWS